MIEEIEIYIKKGAVFSTSCVIQNDDGTPRDLTGVLIAAQLRKYAEASDAVDFAVTVSGNRVTLSLTAVQTAGITYKTGAYDVFIEADDPDDRDLLWQGTAVIYTDVTRMPWLQMGLPMSVLSMPSLADFPVPGMSKMLYLDAAENKLYRWDEAQYVRIQSEFGWDDIDDKPDLFPPSAHTHTVADITDFPTLGTMSAESASDYYTKSATDALLSEKAPIIRTSASGSLVHVTDAAAMPVDALTIEIEPVQGGSGTPAPDNVRPISGHSTATVTRTGGNLIDATTVVASTSKVSVSGTQTSSGSTIIGETTESYAYRGMELIIPSTGLVGQTITMSGVQTGESGASLYAMIRAKTNGSMTGISSSASTTNFSLTATVPQCDEVHLTFQITGSTAASGAKVTVTNLMLNVGSSAELWQPYTAQTVTINLNGTYYGGTVDALTGVMTVDRVMHTFDGTEINNTYGSGANRSAGWSDASISYSVNYSPKVIGNLLKSATGYGDLFQNPSIAIVNNAMIAIHPEVKDTSDENYQQTMDRTSAWLATKYASGTPLQLVYPLATPITVQLTPAELSLLQGTNNVWANSGDVNVGYRADTKLYIDRKIAELQALILDN